MLVTALLLDDILHATTCMLVFRRLLFLLSAVTHFTLQFVSYGILYSESVNFICGFSLL